MHIDCDQIQDLLAKIVSDVCKSSIPFAKEVKVEGLIGITLDANQVFLVRINDAFTRLFESAAVTAPNNRLEEAAVVSVSKCGSTKGSLTADANPAGKMSASPLITGFSSFSTTAEIKDSEVNVLSQNDIIMPPLIQIGCMQSTGPNNDEVILKESCDLLVKRESHEPEAMIVQPADTCDDNDEDTDLIMLCSTTDNSILTMKEQDKRDEDDVQVVHAPHGILDGYQSAALGRRLRNRQNLHQQQHRKELVAKNADDSSMSCILQTSKYDVSCALGNTCTIDLSQDEPVLIDIRPDVTLRDDAANNLDHASSVALACTIAPMITAATSMCTNSNQLLASLGPSIVGLTPVITLPIIVSPTSASSTALGGSSSWQPPVSSRNDDPLLPPEMQRFVAAV